MKLKEELISRDYSKLPEKYWGEQNLCWYLHDVIMSIFTEIIDDNLINTKLSFKNEIDKSQLDESENVYEWLKETGRNDEFTKILCKDLSHRLLGDFLNYVYEVLSNLERGKITIACDLLRKPFKDDLFYLEWILFNDKKLSDLVYEGNIEKYALGRGGVSKEEIKKIIEFNVNENRFINKFSSSELKEEIYNIRYNYDSPNSLELIWNKATHLVTTRKNIKSTDFNFLYHNNIDYDNYWNYLYGKIPLLLLYTIGVVENIFDKYFKKISDENKLYNFTLIISKYTATVTESYEEADKFLNMINGSLNLPCECCDKIVKLKKPESYQFYNYWNVICPKCKEEINICRYFFF